MAHFLLVCAQKEKQDGNRRKLIKQILRAYAFRSMICLNDKLFIGI